MYDYWECFIEQWFSSSSSKAIKGWTDPDAIPLYNNPDTKDMSSDYLPEPWWGNGGSQTLHSVVINFNPGEGGCLQTKGCICYQSSYAGDMVNNSKALPKTRDWHFKKRAKPVLAALKSIGAISCYQGLENHLSLELIPWHTQKVDANYKNYLKKNIMMVYQHSLCFAANEASRIANGKLKNVVLLKMSGDNTKFLVEELIRAGIDAKLGSRGILSIKDGKYLEFSIAKLPGVRFISIWGPKSRNNFPSALENILRSI